MTDTRYPTHLLRAQDFSRPNLDHLFREAEKVKELLKTSNGKEELRSRLQGKVMYSFFAEESTRTRFSFARAATRLGMDVVSCESEKSTSIGKAGETLEHTVRCLLGQAPDVLVLRHRDDDAAERAAFISDQRYASIPVINAGSGKKHHPTQTRLDLFTINELLGSVDGLTIAIGADIRFSRTARSLAYSLCFFMNVTIIAVTPPELAPPDELIKHLKERGVTYEHTTDVCAALNAVDVAYWGRLQAERVEEPKVKESLQRQYDKFRIGTREASVMRRNALIMHPQPVSEQQEIAPEVEEQSPNCRLDVQADNGVPVRVVDVYERLKKHPA